jgi:DNA-binding ferritin-like protein (Dps family)
MLTITIYSIFNYIMDNKHKKDYIEAKKMRRDEKRSEKRNATGEEVIFIFEKILEGWKTIKIYNTIVQTNPKTFIDKKRVEKISTGNCKVFKEELTQENYEYYLELRDKVYNYNCETRSKNNK